MKTIPRGTTATNIELITLNKHIKPRQTPTKLPLKQGATAWTAYDLRLSAVGYAGTSSTSFSHLLTFMNSCFKNSCLITFVLKKLSWVIRVYP